ncbi:MAG: FHA domain-containing protein [Halioglobus sp.]|nr:FHA domain-containing protein [Halioglobus sp.]
MQSRLRSFLRELKRRKILNTCIYYVLFCWVLIQVGEILLPTIGFEVETSLRALLTVEILLFPLVFIFAWYFQISPGGIVRTTHFVERRVLQNIAPINDQRQSGGVTNYFSNQRDEDDHRWTISAETGPLTGLSFGISQPVELGRSLDCALAIVSPHVSRHHARLEVDGHQLFVEDLKSANGTVVNGKPIEGRHALHHEDELRLHDIIFRVTERYTGVPGGNALSQTTFIENPEDAQRMLSPTETHPGAADTPRSD